MEKDEKSEWLRKVKNLAKTDWEYRNGEELLKLMDYYNVNNLMILTTEQIRTYYEKRKVEVDG